MHSYVQVATSSTFNHECELLALMDTPTTRVRADSEPKYVYDLLYLSVFTFTVLHIKLVSV